MLTTQETQAPVQIGEVDPGTNLILSDFKLGSYRSTVTGETVTGLPVF